MWWRELIARRAFDFSPEYIYFLERSRTALWRLIDATAKSSSSLNTYPIPDFFGPAAMQLQTFSRARKILGIRILPRAPTLQTYLFWPIGVNQRRELAQYSSCTALQLRFPIFLDPLQCNVKHFHVRVKKVGYESYPRSQPSKRTLFGRSA